LSLAVAIQREAEVEPVHQSRVNSAATAVADSSICRIHPLADPRWEPFVQKHPRASIFHSSAWLKALSQTYGYETMAFTTSGSGADLDNAVVFCEVDSWLTGRRLVSLPFSDHCEPLAEPETAAAIVMRVIDQDLDQNNLRYVEIRPLNPIRLATQVPRTTVPKSFISKTLQT